MLVVLNILLFRTMKEAERKRERLLNCRQKKAAAGESKESKKLRDSNCTTLMLIVVITVSDDRTRLSVSPWGLPSEATLIQIISK